MNKRKIQGFTLLELMIVVSIIGILAAVSIPSYNRYVQESRRTDATRSLLECAAQLERNYTMRSSYTNPANICNTVSRDGFYSVTPTLTVSTFSLAAAPAAGSPQSGDNVCASFTLNQLGAQTAADSGGNANTAECWKK